jgi:hypothetical protein
LKYLTDIPPRASGNKVIVVIKVAIKGIPNMIVGGEGGD